MALQDAAERQNILTRPPVARLHPSVRTTLPRQTAGFLQALLALGVVTLPAGVPGAQQQGFELGTLGGAQCWLFSAALGGAAIGYRCSSLGSAILLGHRGGGVHAVRVALRRF